MLKAKLKTLTCALPILSLSWSHAAHAEVPTIDVAQRGASIKCDTSTKTAWSAVNDIVGAIGTLTQTGKYLVAMSKISNNLVCSGSGLSEQRVAAIALNTTTKILNEQSIRVLSSLSLDIDSEKGSNRLPSLATLENRYDLLRNEEAGLSALDHTAFDTIVSAAGLKFGFLASLIQQANGAQERAKYQGWLKGQAVNTLTYFDDKEQQLARHLAESEILVREHDRPNCPRDQCFEDWSTGYVTYPNGTVYTTAAMEPSKHANAERFTRQLRRDKSLQILDAAMDPDYKKLKDILWSKAYPDKSEMWLESEGTDGEWQNFNEAKEVRCPDGYYAYRYSLRSHYPAGEFADDTGLNGVKLACLHPSDPVPTANDQDMAKNEISSEVSNPRGVLNGKWGYYRNCSNGRPITGFAMVIESDEDGRVDDTGANAAYMYCGLSPNQELLLAGTPTLWGDVTAPLYCPPGWAVTGLKASVRGASETGMNGLKLICEPYQVQGCQWLNNKSNQWEDTTNLTKSECESRNQCGHGACYRWSVK